MFKPLDANTAAIVSIALIGCATFLLAMPYLWMSRWGWARRKAAVMDRLSDEALKLYWNWFRSRHQANAKSNGAAGNPTSVINPAVELDTLYESEFGKQACRYSMAALIVVWLVGGGLFGFGMWKMFASPTFVPTVAGVAMAAFLGGYTWALSILYERAWQNNLRPSDVAWAAFRMAIATPLGLAIVWFFVGAVDVKNMPLAMGVAYLLGTFPTVTLMEFGQLVVRRFVHIPGVTNQQISELQKLPSVDAFAAQTLRGYGITHPEQLATCDPVHLCWSTGLSFDYIVICVLDSLAWSYIGDERMYAAVTKLGVRGAYDFANLNWDLELDNGYLEYKDAMEVVRAMSSVLGSNEAGIRNMAWNIAQDPLVTFLIAVWWEDKGSGKKPTKKKKKKKKRKARR